MRIRTTLILLLLVAGLAVFIFSYERHQRTTLEKRVAGSLTGFDSKEIDTIELKNASGTVKFKKRSSDNRWMITDPIDDRVEPVFMARLLALADKAEISATIPDDQMKDSDRSRYGLDDKSAIQISWRNDGKTVGRLKLGKSGALGETAYAEAPGNKEFTDVYLIWAKPEEKSANVRDDLNRPLEEMRDTLLLPFKAPEVVSFTVRRPGTVGEIEVQRALISGKEATPWELTKPLKTRGEQTKVDYFVSLFTGGRVSKLLPSTPAPTGLPANPAAEVQFQNSLTSKGSTIRFYPPDPPDSKFITGYLTDRKTWFTIDSDWLLAVPESPNELRGRTLADLDEKKITTILINHVQGDPIALYRIENRWFIQKGDDKFLAASSDRVIKTIQALNQAEIGSFVTDSLTKPADYGLDKPYETVTIGTPDHVRGKGLGELNAKNSLVLQFSQDAENKIYANYKGETSVYMMQPEHLTLVPWRETDWRSLQILDFNRYSVRRLQQTIGTQPIVTLKALPRSAEWTAETAGADATAFISREVIEKMINRLGTFNVNHWVAGLQEGHDALLAPSLEIELDVEYANDRSALDKPSTKTIHLTFAPAGDPKTALYYYGRCTDYADYFRITREIYNELAAPVLKK